MATIRLASATWSTYCGGADGDSPGGQNRLNLGSQAGPGLGFELPRRCPRGDGDRIVHWPSPSGVSAVSG